MFTKYLVVLSLFIFSTDCAFEDYQFESGINGFLKLHHVPAKWQDARLRCHLEGGVLASPTTTNEFTAMTNIMAENNSSPNRVYTGIHSTYSYGDYTTLTGVPLSQIDVKWELGAPTFENREGCVILLESGELSDVDCVSTHPYICYKSIEKIDIHTCSTNFSNSEYTYENSTGSCYKFHKEKRSWPMAFKTCMAEGAYLAIINSEVESRVLSRFFNVYPHDDDDDSFNIDSFDDDDDDEYLKRPHKAILQASIGFSMWREYGEWFTIHGTSIAEAGFSKFNKGEPNNEGGNEWCGSVWRNGLLNDHACDRMLTFICEKTPSDVDMRFIRLDTDIQ